jgi:hypothetical protein
MDRRIILIDCLCDNDLKPIQQREASQRRVCDAEIMPAGLGAALQWCGNVAAANRFMSHHRDLGDERRRRRLRRRLHGRQAPFLMRLAH